MREILFRGKRLDNGEWVEGDILQFQDRVVVHCYERGCRVSYEVDCLTIGQYTGMKDKNGKRIFEGDIVRGPRCPDETVKFRLGGFYPFSIAGWECEEDPDCVEVIGNIHSET